MRNCGCAACNRRCELERQDLPKLKEIVEGMAKERDNPTREQLAADPVLFIETVGWGPEPGYIPPWQKKFLADLCGRFGKVMP